MAVKYGKKKNKQHNILYTIVTAMLLCAVFLAMVGYLYNNTKEEEYENLSDEEFSDKYKWHFLGPIIGILVVSLGIIIYTIQIAGL